MIWQSTVRAAEGGAVGELVKVGGRGNERHQSLLTGALGLHKGHVCTRPAHTHGHTHTHRDTHTLLSGKAQDGGHRGITDL